MADRVLKFAGDSVLSELAGLVIKQNADGTYSFGRGDSATKLTAVTKSDSTVLTGVRALYIGGTGDVSVLAVGDTAAVTFKAVPVGTVLPVAAQKVMAATTATDIVALY